MRGLPASGKSTCAKKLVEEGFKRVNKDDLRLMVDNWKYSKKNEKMIDELELSMVDQLLRAGYSVVIDDTNGSQKRVDMIYRLFEVDVMYDFELLVEEMLLTTPVDVCIERDKKRKDSVWENVIKTMWETHFKKLY